MIKSIKKQSSLLAIHLNDTPIISLDKSLQNYIKQKLNLDFDLFAKNHLQSFTEDLDPEEA